MKKIFNYLKTPSHALTITVVGCGGTGTRFLKELASMTVAYAALRRVRLQVLACDPDIVTEANVGRQLYSHAEVGMNKAHCIISKINRTYGLQWQSTDHSFEDFANEDHWKEIGSNFMVTCVDNVATRRAMQKMLASVPEIRLGYEVPAETFFWLDLGNTKTSGQVIIKSPQSPSIIDLYPDIADTDDNTPSCSLAEALGKQDLFVNPFVAMLAAKMLWEILLDYEQKWSAAYFNLDNFNIKRVPVTPHESTVHLPQSRGETKEHKQKGNKRDRSAAAGYLPRSN